MLICESTYGKQVRRGASLVRFANPSHRGNEIAKVQEPREVREKILTGGKRDLAQTNNAMRDNN